MKFKDKIQIYFAVKNIIIGKIEQDGEVESVVIHIPKSENEKIDSIKNEMQKDLDVVVMRSDSYGMNVVIVEAKNLEG